MRLTKVRVTKLFGLFDHEIPLNLGERITIIHGPNGFGKTIVLRMLAALISGKYDLFREVPFETFAVESDEGCLTVEHKEREVDFPPSMEREINLQFSISVPDASASTDSHERTVAKVKGSAVAKLFAEGPTVRLIRTQRLDIKEYGKRSLLGAGGGTFGIRSTVEVYAEELSAQMHQILAAYATKSQELDRTFPARLLSQIKTEPLTTEELRKRMAGLEQKRSMLMQLGFLEPEQGLEQASAQAIEAKRDVLSVYVDDVESKLAVFDEMASKIQLFTRIINGRFLLKRLETHRDQGFFFTSATGARLKPSDLSSGEQHELILFYELLFKLEKNALILIDEPEISLHVAWQEKFLGDLMEVVKLSEIDVVVATHSPEIIGEHWDLTVELKGPSEMMGSSELREG
jgi:predicted ATP-binding protein involved in virulence